MEIRITIRATAKGGTLATVCTISPGMVRWQRVTMHKGHDPEALHRQLRSAVLSVLEREAGPESLRLVMDGG